MRGMNQLIFTDFNPGFFAGFPDRCTERGRIFQSSRFIIAKILIIQPATGEDPVPSMEHQPGISLHQKHFKFLLPGIFPDQNNRRRGHWLDISHLNSY